MLLLSDVVCELQRFWAGAAPAGTATQFPGVPLDAAELECWYEFWVSQLDEPPHRTAGKERRSLVIDLHCFARGRDKRRAAGLADAAQTALAHTELPVRPAGSQEAPVGWLRLRECQLRDLTRESTAVAQLPLQHVMASIAAVLEEV